MTSSIEYALMASNAYAVKDLVTSENNAIPIPNGWVDMEADRINNDSGFTARAYRNTGTGEIVIAYTGTTFEGNLVDKTKDWMLANIPAGTGAFLAPQVTDAAMFYLDVLNANPGASISFTGHSLGGGLASLMAVFFDRPATVFDEAPFEKTADSLERVEELKKALLEAHYTLPAAFANYDAYAYLNVNGAFIPSPTRRDRDDKVTHYYVRDEVLSLMQTFTGQAALLGIGVLNQGQLLTLAANVHPIYGKQYYLEGNATSGNGWGWPGFDGNPVDMHSMALLDAFLMSPAFLAASRARPELLQALFTSEFNYAQQSADYNLLSLLVRRQVAGEKPLETLVADIGRVRDELASPGIAGPGIGYILTYLALSLYYAQGFGRETGAESGIFQQVFTPLDGGIQINRDPAQEELTVHGFANLEAWLRGQVDLAAYSLAGIERYYLSDGRSMHATTPNDARNDFMLGGNKADVLLGGDGDDFLFGEGGADWLEGGKGNDVLAGGWGQDIYRWRTGDGQDKIIDVDGGWLYINDGLYDLNAAGVFNRQKDAAGNVLNVWTRTLPGGTVLTLTHNSPWTLVLPDGGTLQLGEAQEDFQPGDFGIRLVEDPAFPQTTLTITGDLSPVDQDPVQGGVQPGYDVLDNIITDPRQADPGRADILYDSVGDDLVLGLGGDDILFAHRGGHDRLEGGDGNDMVDAGTGDDTALGNAGQDLIYGLSGNDRLFAGDEQDLDTALMAGEGQAGTGLKGDLLGGGEGEDCLVGEAGDDALAGGAGEDRLLGGGGDDMLAGDEDLTGATLGWTLTRLIDLDANVNTTYERQFTNATAMESANGGADVLYGGAGEDWLLGQQGDDILDGGSGGDVLFGGADDDVLLGQGGDDDLIGDDAMLPAFQHGGDFLDGGEGNDKLLGGGGADRLEGGEGDDRLWGQAGEDHLDGDGGQDWLMGDDLGLPGEQHGADALTGGTGDDFLFGQGGADQLQGGQGNDYVQGDDGGLAGEYHGDDQLEGGAGDDSLIGDGGSDALEGGDGADLLYGDNAPNQPLAEDFQGNDTLTGGEGDDLLLGGGGNDVLHGGAGQDGLDGGAGDDVYLFDPEDSPLLNGIAESVSDFAGNDRIEFGPGVSPDDVELLKFDQDMALGFGSADWLYIREGFSGSIENFGFSDGTRLSWMQLVGRAYGASANASTADRDAVMVGGSVNDALTATGGGATFSGGQGNDTLTGAGGGNTYLYSLGDGTDWINDTGGQLDADGNPNPNVLRFGEGISEVVLTLKRGPLVIQVGPDSNDTIYLNNFRNWDVHARRAIDRFEFFDGTSLTYEELLAKGFVVQGSDEYDSIWGTNVDDWIEGGASGDSLVGNPGNDTLHGGLGNDTLSDNQGSDTFLFSLGGGVDTINVASGPEDTDVLRFGAGISPADISPAGSGKDLELRHANGTDKVIIQNWFDATQGEHRLDRVEFADGTLWGEARLSDAVLNLTGSAADDLLAGSERDEVFNGAGGNDTLDGGEGNDTYLFDPGGGSDTVIEKLGDVTKDVLRFGPGITPADITYVRIGDDLEFRHVDGVDKVVVADWFLTSKALYQLDVVEFADGTLWTQAEINAEFVTIIGTDGNDTLEGTGLDEVISGLAGNDDLIGQYGSDTLNGGDGNDTLEGGAGYDTYLFELGGGQDVIQETPEAYHSHGVLKFGEGILVSDITVLRDWENLVFIHRNGTDMVTAVGWFRYDPSPFVYNYYYQLESVDFADGTQWTKGHLNALGMTISGTSGNESLYGTGYNETLHGLAGNDTLAGDEGNDTLHGGDGDDHLYGGEGDDLISGGKDNDTLLDGLGNDTFVFNLGEGVDTISVSHGQYYTDVLKLGPGIRPDDVAAVVSGNNLELTLAGGEDKIVFANWFLGSTGYYQLDRLEFADGTQWNQAKINSLPYTLTGTVVDDLLIGSSPDETLYGLEGNDTLDGGGGADGMAGGKGDDTYIVDNPGDVASESSGEGFDTVQSSIGFTLSANLENLALTGGLAIDGTGNELANTLGGNDAANTLFGLAGNDTLRGGMGIDTLVGGLGSDVYMVDRPEDVVTELANEGTDTVKADFTYVLGDNLEKLALTGSAAVFGTGNSLNNGLTGNRGANTLRGLGGNDTLNGGIGADTMIGGMGNDIFVVDVVSDLVVENPGKGSDLVKSATTYTLPANIENLILTGKGAINGAGNKHDNDLIGNTAGNMLKGLGGRDTLNGGAGKDTLVGGSGSDVYLLNLGNGSDTVRENDSTVGNTDTARFGPGVGHDQIWFRKVGNHMEASVIGTTDRLVLQNWYRGAAYRTERFVSGDGQVLLDNQVDALVSAMAAFAPPAAGSTNLPDHYRTALEPVLAVNWQ